MIKKTFKYTGLFLLVFIFFSLMSVLGLFFSKAPHNYLRNFVIETVKDSFVYPVEIGEIEGNFLSSVELKNVKILNNLSGGHSKSVLVAEKINVEYNLWDFWLSKYGLKKRKITIRLDKPIVNVEHYRDDTFNFFKMFSDSDSDPDGAFSSGNFKLPFDIQVIFADAQISYYDERGFFSEPLLKPVYSQGSLDVELNLDNNGIGCFAVGNIRDVVDYKPISVVANVMLKTGEFNIGVKSSRLSLQKWGNYFYSLPGFSFVDGYADVEVGLKNLEKGTTLNVGDVPFLYDVDVNARKSAVLLPWLKKPLQDTSGQILITNKKIEFNKVQGLVASNHYRFTGKLYNFSDLKADMDIYLSDFDAASSHEFVETLDGWGIKGKGPMKIDIGTQGQNHWRVFGNTYIEDGEIYSHKINDANVFFRLENEKVYVDVTKAKFYGGDLIVKSVVDQQHNDFVSLKGSLVGAYSEQLFRNKNYFDGQIDIDIAAAGPPENLKFVMKGSSDDFLVAGQRIPELAINLTRTPEYLNFNKIEIKTLYNDSLIAQGCLFSDKSFEFKVSGNKTLVNNLNFDFSDVYLAADVDSQLTVKGIWDEPLFADPLQHLDIISYFNASNIVVGEENIQNAVFSAVISDGKFSIENVEVTEPSASINADFIFDEKGLLWAHAFSNKFPLKKMKVINGKLPEPVRPLVGDLSGEILYSSLGKNKLSASVNVKNLEGIKYQKFESVSANINWDGKLFRINEGGIVNNASKVSFSGNYLKDKGVDLLFLSDSFNLNDFSGLTSEYGNFSGYGSGAARVTGKNFFSVSLNAQINDARYEDIYLDKIEGGFRHLPDRVAFDNINVRYGEDKYAVSGFIGTAGNSDHNIDLLVEQVSLKNLISLIERGYGQFNLLKNNSFVFKTLMPEENVLKNYLTLGKGYGALSSSMLYSSRPSSFSFLKDYLDQVSYLGRGSASDSNSWADLFGGILSGEIRSSKIADKAILTGDIAVERGYFSFVTFDTMRASVKQDGLNYNISTNIYRGKMGDAEYDSLSSEIVYDENRNLNVQKFDFAALGQKPHNIMKGLIPLGSVWGSANNKKFDLSVDLSRNNINLISVFNNNISSIKNNGDFLFHIGGTLEKPVINSTKLELKSAAITLSEDLYFKSSFKVPSSSLLIRENLISIPSTEFFWKGKDTSYDQNKFILSGGISLQNLSFFPFDKVVLGFDVRLKDTEIRIVMPKLFSGYISAKDLSFIGPLTIPISKDAKRQEYENYLASNESGPVLKGDLNIYDAEIPLQSKKTFILKPSILFELNASILNGVYVSGGSLAKSGLTGLVNGIDVALKEKSSPLYVHGSLNNVLVDGEVALDNGEISIFDRIFRVLPYDYQQKYLAYDNSLKKNNTIAFVSEYYESEKRKKTIPFFSIATVSEIDAVTSNITDDESEAYLYTGIMHYLVLIEGKLNDPGSMTIFRFNQLKNYNYELMDGYPIIPGALTDDEVTELARYLLPDLLRPELYEELFSKGFSSDKARQALGNLSETQINSLFSRQLRPIERDVANTIGAHDIRIDYNLGKAVNKAVASAEEYEQEKETIIGLDIAYKLFFDRLYVRFRTQLDQDKTSRDVYLNLAEYKLSYSIYEWLSFNYLNRTTLDDDQLPEVYSLEALYRF